MSSLERFQNVVLGGGEAGKYIAWELARWGQPVAVVARGLIGGSCPNIACLPSKNVIHSAKVVGLVRRASTFGLRLGPWSVDMAGVRRRKRELVNGMIAIHKAQFAANGREFILRGSLRWAQDDRSSAHARWPPMRSAFRPMTLSS